MGRIIGISDIHGEYVPTSVGNQSIDYGYNAQGDFVPTSIGK